MVSETSFATRLLDAQVAYRHGCLVVQRLLATVPGSVATTTLVQAGADIVYRGPEEPVAAADVIDRAQVEAAVDHALGFTPALERALDSLSDSPMVGTVASRFVSRIVVDVLQANRSVAEKIPGVGSIMSLGTNAASKVIGVADKPLQQLVGDTTGKGAAFALRRLNKVVIQTLEDPATRDALLEIWDRVAELPIEGLEGHVALEDVRRAAGTVQTTAAAAAAGPAAQQFAATFTEALSTSTGSTPS